MQNGGIAENAATFAPCNICGSGEYREICGITISPFSAPSKLVKCKRCGFFYANPRHKKEVEEDYYRRRYHEDQQEGYWYKGRLDVFKRSLREMSKFVKKGRLIDVGCGRGYFMDLARSDGWEVNGVEISESAACHAGQTLKLDVIKDGLKDALFPAEYFDAATMWNVLDQLYDPRANLAELNRILKRGGYVFIRVSNGYFHLPLFRLCAGLKALFSNVDDSIFTFHLYSFDQDSIKRLLGSMGFSGVVVRTERMGVNVPDFVKVVGARMESLSRKFFDIGSEIVYYCSLGKAVVSPSIFVIAKKEKNI